MIVTVNGRGEELPGGATVESAVRASGASPEQRGLAVAVDGEVVPRGRWALTPLDEGQRVEVVHAVQGG
jgi:sulfur carrier protein